MPKLKDLTHGPITRQLITLIWPLVIGNILQQLYNTIDALVVGRFVGTDAFAAIGIAGTVMNLFIFILVGGCTGIGIIWAQLYGKGDWAKFRQEGFLAFSAGTAFTLAVSAIGILGMHALLQLISTPQSILHLVSEYLVIIMGGLIMTFLYNYCSTLLRAVGNTFMALVFLAVAMAINFVLDLVFIACFGWGIAGAAWATVIAQGISVLCCYAYLELRMPMLLWRRADMRYDHDLLKQTCNYGMVTAIHNSNLYIGKMLVQGAVNSCGVDMVAAYTATSRLEGFINSFGDSGTAAMNVFLAQNYGAGNKQRIKEGFWHGWRLLIVFSLFASVIMYVTASAGVGFLLGETSGEAFTQGVSYMHAIAFFYWICFTGNAVCGYFEGVGKLVIPIIGATAHITIRVILSYLFIGEYGLPLVAYATGIGWFLAIGWWFWLVCTDLKSTR